MPPSRRPPAIRDTSDMVDDNALHITQEQAAVFGEPREVLKKSEAEHLRAKAARADELEEQIAQVLAEQGQSSALALQDGSLMIQGFQFSPTGLIAPEQFSEEAWQQIGLLLFKLEGAIQWLIGDWIVYGNQVGWGDIPKLAEALGREPQTLNEYAYVCRNVQLWVRTHNLSYGHHKLVAPLEPENQVKVLALAAKQGLSIAAFRKLLRGEQPDLLESKEPRYNPTKMLDTALHVSEQDLSSIPLRELKSATDAFDIVIRIATERRQRLIDAFEQRSQK